MSLNVSLSKFCMKCLLLIPARSGSKGLVRKNLAKLGGRHLIDWTIEQAIASQAGDVIVSTDSEEIAKAASGAGADVPFLRPAPLATDQASIEGVAEHALQWLLQHRHVTPDTVVLLQPTSPFRSAEDISAGLDLLVRGRAPAVVAVCESSTHPFVVRKIEKDGTLSYFVNDAAFTKRRQDFPPAYQVNGALYVIRTEVLRIAQTFQPSGSLAYIMPPERSLDIDNAADLSWAEWQLVNR